MFVSKPLASLSSGLLARKGQARPAMRPQAYATLSSVTPVDDLGWNDMGTDPGDPADSARAADLPPVLLERAALKEEVELPAATAGAPGEAIAASAAIAAEPRAEPGSADAEPEPERDPEPGASLDVRAIAGPLLQPRAAGRGKAAFTLRLDGVRHLRLRLASAVTHRSSQALLVQALDTFLDTLPEVEELARRCSASDLLGDPQ